MKAMILAAGEGTRLRPVTARIPKPMVALDGKPILEHLVEGLAASGITDLIINLHYRADDIRGHFTDGSRWGVRITYSHEDRLLGTAGAVRAVADLLTEPFLVVYGDNFHRCPYAPLLDFHRANAALSTLLVHPRSHVSQSGVVQMDADGLVRSFIEKPSHRAAPHGLVNAGVYAAEPGILNYIPDEVPCDFARDVFPRMLDAGERIFAYRLESPLVWIDSVADYGRAVGFAGRDGPEGS